MFEFIAMQGRGSGSKMYNVHLLKREMFWLAIFRLVGVSFFACFVAFWVINGLLEYYIVEVFVGHAQCDFVAHKYRFELKLLFLKIGHQKRCQCQHRNSGLPRTPRSRGGGQHACKGIATRRKRESSGRRAARVMGSAVNPK